MGVQSTNPNPYARFSIDIVHGCTNVIIGLRINRWDMAEGSKFEISRQFDKISWITTRNYITIGFFLTIDSDETAHRWLFWIFCTFKEYKKCPIVYQLPYDLKLEFSLYFQIITILYCLFCDFFFNFLKTWYNENVSFESSSFFCSDQLFLKVSQKGTLFLDIETDF